MNSSMIGKIEKAHRYAQETDRVAFNTFDATIHGDNSDYSVRLTDNGWECTCPTFRTNTLGTCSHVMAMQLMLGSMLGDDDRYSSQLEEAAAE